MSEKGEKTSRVDGELEQRNNNLEQLETSQEFFAICMHRVVILVVVVVIVVVVVVVEIEEQSTVLVTCEKNRAQVAIEEGTETSRQEKVVRCRMKLHIEDNLFLLILILFLLLQ